MLDRSTAALTALLVIILHSGMRVLRDPNVAFDSSNQIKKIKKNVHLVDRHSLNVLNTIYSYSVEMIAQCLQASVLLLFFFFCL